MAENQPALKCPRCGTILKPNAMMCLHCGAMIKSDPSGTVNVVGHSQTPLNRTTGMNGNFSQSNTRVIEADKPTDQPKNKYIKKDALSTGNLNPVDEKSYLKASSKERVGILYAKNVKINADLIDIYIGDRGEELRGLSVNWAAFIFGPFWYLYRKQILPAVLYVLLYFGICYAVITWIPTLPILVITLLFMIVNLFFANMIYVAFVKFTLSTYQLFHRRIGADEFMTRIEKKGGTSIKYALVGFVITVLALGTYIYLYHNGDVQVIADFIL